MRMTPSILVLRRSNPKKKMRRCEPISCNDAMRDRYKSTRCCRSRRRSFRLSPRPIKFSTRKRSRDDLANGIEADYLNPQVSQLSIAVSTYSLAKSLFHVLVYRLFIALRLVILAGSQGTSITDRTGL